MRILMLLHTFLMNSSVKWVFVASWVLVANVSSEKYQNTYDVTSELIRRDPSSLRMVLFPALDFDDNSSRLLAAVSSNPEVSSIDADDDIEKEMEDPQSKEESKRGPLFGCRHSYHDRDSLLADMRKRQSSRALREELFKRSSLNQLIRRLMAMKGQSFTGGRALNIRFGVGGR